MQDNSTLEQVSEITPVQSEQPQEIEQPVVEAEVRDNVKNDISYGKFKSAESLYEGYLQLQKEFTKKCQSLKEFENQKEDYSEIVNKMITANPKLEQMADELVDFATKGGNIGVLLAEKLVGKINEPCDIIKDEQFLRDFVYGNEKITEKIISDYLDSLSAIKVPQTIKSGGNSYVSPTYKPRTLNEAGNLAKKFIESRRI